MRHDLWSFLTSNSAVIFKWFSLIRWLPCCQICSRLNVFMLPYHMCAWLKKPSRYNFAYGQTCHIILLVLFWRHLSCGTPSFCFSMDALLLSLATHLSPWDCSWLVLKNSLCPFPLSGTQCLPLPRFISFWMKHILQ